MWNLLMTKQLWLWTVSLGKSIKKLNVLFGGKYHLGSYQWHWKYSRAFGHRHMASQSSTQPWFSMKVKSIISWFHIQVFLRYLNLLLYWKEDNGRNEATKFQVVDFIGHFFQATDVVMFSFMHRTFSRWMNHFITMFTYLFLRTWDLKSFNLKFGYFYMRNFFILRSALNSLLWLLMSSICYYYLLF
jgi:hypothetical protein